jgi:hypothetical protein
MLLSTEYCPSPTKSFERKANEIWNSADLTKRSKTYVGGLTLWGSLVRSQYRPRFPVYLYLPRFLKCYDQISFKYLNFLFFEPRNHLR